MNNFEKVISEIDYIENIDNEFAEILLLENGLEPNEEYFEYNIIHIYKIIVDIISHIMFSILCSNRHMPKGVDFNTYNRFLNRKRYWLENKIKYLENQVTVGYLFDS